MKAKTKAKRKPPNVPSEPSHVVGIGGSAGSLEPLEQFFRALRPDTSMSFVVVTHRDPRSKGMMVEILARFTQLRVCEATQGAPFERGVVYVVPSDRHLDTRNGCIALRNRPSDPRSRTPIDSLFRAIARDRHERSVGVVLSGMGSDGTVGLGAIKENLGIALVQAPASAAYDAMPASAIAAGLADFVGTPESLAEILNGFVDHALSMTPLDGGRGHATRAASAAPVLAAVRARTGHDFAEYKKSTIVRRIERRMNLHHISDVAGYLELFAREPAEVD